MAITIFFAVISGLLTLLASYLYLLSLIKESNILNNKFKPNAISWAIWFLADSLNLYTYFTLVKGDMLEMIFLIICTLETLVVLSFLIHKRIASKPEIYEIILIFFIISIIPFQLITAETRISNLVLQLVYVVGFIPIILGIIQKRNNEINYYAWGLAALGALFSVFILLSNFHGDLLSFISPVVILIGDSIVFVLILKNKKKHVS